LLSKSKSELEQNRTPSRIVLDGVDYDINIYRNNTQIKEIHVYSPDDISHPVIFDYIQQIRRIEKNANNR